MTRAQKKARARRLEREIDERIANLPRVPRVRLVKARKEIQQMRTEAVRLAGDGLLLPKTAKDPDERRARAA